MEIVTVIVGASATLAGGIASAVGGHIAARRQQAEAGLAAAKLMVAELARNSLSLQGGSVAGPVAGRIFRHSFRPSFSVWATYAHDLTRLVDNETLLSTASAYVQTELATVIGASDENRASAVVAIRESLDALRVVIHRCESLEMRLTPDLHIDEVPLPPLDEEELSLRL